MKYDYLIVGAGLFGATFAYLATKAGKRCLVIDRRNHVGGNVYCEEITGINVHKYGAHIFHTNNKDIWDFVNSLVPFNRYTNCPLAKGPDGKIYNLPFNMNTFNRMWGIETPAQAEEFVNRQRREAWENLKYEGIDQPRNLEEQALCLVGTDIYETLIKHYTEKQWGRTCRKLPAFIIRRLPVRFTYDNNYFNDRYQGIPIGGYNNLINRLLEGCDIRTGINFEGEIKLNWRGIASKLVYTGAIDEYHDYKYGRLQWRTVRFDTEVLPTPNFQGNAVINYTGPLEKFTRIIEHKHFETFGTDVYKIPHTVISREYSMEYQPGMEPYYPINDESNNKLADNYRILAEAENDVIFGGRLAEYKYYDMAPVIAKAFEAWRKQQNL